MGGTTPLLNFTTATRKISFLYQPSLPCGNNIKTVLSCTDKLTPFLYNIGTITLENISIQKSQFNLFFNGSNWPIGIITCCYIILFIDIVLYCELFSFVLIQASQNRTVDHLQFVLCVLVLVLVQSQQQPGLIGPKSPQKYCTAITKS